MAISEMKRFLVKLCVLAIIVIVVDKVIGFSLTYMRRQIRSEKSCDYIFSEVKQDVLIFGSSRSYRHYDTRIISDTLGLSCFNCGQTGQGFIYNYALLKKVLQHHMPKLIIYDIYPTADLFQGDNIRYIKELRPYYKDKDIRDVILKVDASECYKINSKMYCYNDICNKILLDFFSVIPAEESFNGYVPIHKKMSKPGLMPISNECFQPDSLKLSFAKDFIELAKKTNVVFTMSPFLCGGNVHSRDLVLKLTEEYNIPFIDYSSSSLFLDNNEYFYDSIHMNSEGSIEFSKEIASVLKKYINN